MKRKFDEFNNQNILIEKEDKCPICMEDLQNKNLTITKCGHKFCHTCIDIHSCSDSKCPVCRTDMKTKKQIDDVAQTKIRETQANNLFNAITRLKKDEGFSITLDGKDVTELYKEGFMVAPLKKTEIIFDSKTFSLADAQKLLDNVEALEKATKGRYKEVYAGAWFNPDDGKFYLDASVRIDNKADALYIANNTLLTVSNTFDLLLE